MSKKLYEKRCVNLEIRAEQEADKPVVVSGYAAKFDSPSEDLGFIETIKPGAFKKTLQESDVRMLWQHDSQVVLARKSIGDLTLREDETGLYFEWKPNLEIRYVQDAVEAIRSGLVSQMSFGFRTIKDSWDFSAEDVVKRDLLEVQLYEISPVTWPAFDSTEVSVRDLVSNHSDQTKRDALLKLLEAREHQAEQTTTEAAPQNEAAPDRRSLITVELELLKLKKD